MPKKINEKLKARAVRLVQDHCAEYSSLSSLSSLSVAVTVTVTKCPSSGPGEEGLLAASATSRSGAS